MNPTSNHITPLVRELIAYLRSFEDEDRERGQKAAENLERSLENSIVPAQSDQAFWVGEVGSKGMLDWQWSDQHRRQLEHLTQHPAERGISPTRLNVFRFCQRWIGGASSGFTFP